MKANWVGVCISFLKGLTLLDTRILGFTIHSDRFISLHQSNGRSATNKYFQIIGSIHDIESYFPIDNRSSLNVQIFFCNSLARETKIYYFYQEQLFYLQEFLIGCTLLGLIVYSSYITL